MLRRNGCHQRLATHIVKMFLAVNVQPAECQAQADPLLMQHMQNIILWGSQHFDIQQRVAFRQRFHRRQ
ncbi:hypothetical protein D3C80_1875770 [compost metagenome]